MEYILNTINGFLCIFSGHKKETHLHENDHMIFSKRCKNCKITLMNDSLVKVISFPPPNSSQEDIDNWESFIKKEEQSFRDKYK